MLFCFDVDDLIAGLADRFFERGYIKRTIADDFSRAFAVRGLDGFDLAGAPYRIVDMTLAHRAHHSVYL